MPKWRTMHLIEGGRVENKRYLRPKIFIFSVRGWQKDDRSKTRRRRRRRREKKRIRNKCLEADGESD
jgi:hypothetical protein